MALLFGTFGVHKFYLGRVGPGMLYVVFFWTFIPAILGFIDAAVLLAMNDAAFQAKYQ